MDEYIEREAALSVIRKLNTPAKSPAQKDMLRTASVYIQEIPAADVAPVVHGRWVEWCPPKHMILTGEEMLYRCSSCDAKYSDVESFRFCPTAAQRWIWRDDDGRTEAVPVLRRESIHQKIHRWQN